MAAEFQQAVRKIVFTGSRIDAIVGLNATRYGATIDLNDPDMAAVKKALDTLSDRIIDVVKANLARGLEDHLSPSTRASLIS